jgi:cathepsin A (carboxypeptidase C)
MKGIASLALVGAATAFNGNGQQPLQLPNILKDTASSIADTASSWDKPMHKLNEALKSLTGEARQVWDEVAMMFPEEMSKANFWSTPKPHVKRPDSQWDHVMSGKDVEEVWVTNTKGEKERDVDGKLANYQLRTKKVDPSKLGVDTVKQYSGYLDDDEEDKHLFYCELSSVASCERIC